MWESLAIIAGVLFASGLALRSMGWLVRTRGLRRLGEAQRVREARGVDLRLMIQGQALRGFRPGRTHVLRGELVLTEDRLLLSTQRGIALDERVGGSLVSVRCTGPARLVLEGEQPARDRSKAPTLYRLELVLPKAGAWARAIGPLCREGAVVGPAAFDAG